MSSTLKRTFNQWRTDRAVILAQVNKGAPPVRDVAFLSKQVSADLLPGLSHDEYLEIFEVASYVVDELMMIGDRSNATDAQRQRHRAEVNEHAKAIEGKIASGEFSVFTGGGTATTKLSPFVFMKRTDAANYAAGLGLAFGDTAPAAGGGEQRAAAPAPAGNWVLDAQTRAREIIKEQHARDLYPNQIGIADQIATEFRRTGVVGIDGKPLTGSTIKRHALRGISSAVGKQLSTTIVWGK